MDKKKDNSFAQLIYQMCHPCLIKIDNRLFWGNFPCTNKNLNVKNYHYLMICFIVFNKAYGSFSTICIDSFTSAFSPAFISLSLSPII